VEVEKKSPAVSLFELVLHAGGSDGAETESNRSTNGKEDIWANEAEPQ